MSGASGKTLGYMDRYGSGEGHLVIDLWRVSEEDLPLSSLVGAVCSLERNRSAEYLARVGALLKDWLGGEQDREVRRAFVDWL